MNKSKLMMSVVLVLVNAAIVMAMGKPDFVLVNDTGLTIDEIQIIPSNGNNLTRFKNIKLKDEQSFKVKLLDELKNDDKFSITIIADNTTIKSSGKIKVEKNQNIPPAFDMQIKKGFTKGKFVGGTTGAVVGVSGLGASAAAVSAGLLEIGALTGGPAIVHALVVLGGSMAGGIAVVAAIPIGLATVGYVVGTKLESEKVVLTPIPGNK